MTTFVTYTRVSTRSQGKDGLGMQSQKAILDHYLAGKEVVAEFAEVASAKDIDGRPELQRAIAMCVKGGHTLAVAKLDRLSRRTEDALKIWGDLDAKLYSCDIPQDNGRMDKFTLTIFMALADRERELISIRTRAGLAHSDKPLGKHPNQQAHYFTSDQQQHGHETMRQKAIDADKASGAYRSIVGLKKEGKSLRAIAQQLNDDNMRTRNGGKFHPTTVKRILDRAAA